jgi:hypothetical protein
MSLGEITCLRCKTKVTIQHPESSVGAIAKESGYFAIIQTTTEFKWMCPGCIDLVVPHVRALADLFSSCEHLHWGGLPYLLKKRAEGVDGGSDQEENNTNG